MLALRCLCGRCGERISSSPCSKVKARCRVWKRFRVAEVIEMIEVLHHQLDNLRLVADVVALGRGLVVTLGCFELDDASVSLLLQSVMILWTSVDSSITLNVPCLNAALK